MYVMLCYLLLQIVIGTEWPYCVNVSLLTNVILANIRHMWLSLWHNQVIIERSYKQYMFINMRIWFSDTFVLCLYYMRYTMIIWYTVPIGDGVECSSVARKVVS